MSETRISKNMLINAAMLGLFAIAGTALVAFTHNSTQHRVEANKRDYLLRQLHQLIPSSQHDNELERDIITVSDTLLGSSTELLVYRARLQGKPVAAIIECIAPDGYSGKIKLLVGVQYDGKLAGVRVVEHLETPGLGDAIDTKKSDWIRQFDGKSLNQPDPTDWRVKRDGGQFDQITSATITSRAVVKATRNALQYFQAQRDHLFDTTP